jgi:hypothetical protein
MANAIITRTTRTPDQHRGYPRRQEAAHHENITVGEVEHLQDAVDQGVPERDEGVEAPGLQPVDELLGKVLEEVLHWSSRGTDDPSPSLFTP